MKVSLNTVKQYTDIDVSTDALVELVNARLGGIEETIDLARRYEKATIVKVVEAVQHPNADRLRVTKIDDAGTRNDVPRDENGHIQVVCGAPNVHAGMYAVWLPPTATVPASFAEDEQFTLSARELRGIMSQGMLAASDELAIGSDHEGIVAITQRDLPLHEKRTLAELVGASFAQVFGLDDTILDIENKMFTHRPDLFGQLGVAREIAGIQHRRFHSPEWYSDTPVFASASDCVLTVDNQASHLVPRMMAVVIDKVAVQPSPLWLQVELMRLGSKSINTVVDITNYCMLLTAQPVHAYDYDMIRGHTLTARLAHHDERLTVLNGKTYTLDESDIVIADAEGPIGLAGIMGGSESEVSESTTRIVLEVATFDMYAVRKTSMRHGIFTDALARFNKGQSPRQNANSMQYLIGMIQSVAGGVQASDVIDLYDERSIEQSAPITIQSDFINKRLGISLATEEISSLLRAVEFQVHDTEDGLVVTAPFWRTDIELPEDVLEEVGRLYGYDRLPRRLPMRSMRSAPRNETRLLAARVREALARGGANEVLTYSFVHADVIKKATQAIDDAYTLSNALSPDLQYYRLSLTPSLLDKVHMNIKAGFDEFALFEIGVSHSKKAGFDEEGLPVEPGRIALVYAAKKPHDGAAYYRARRQLDFLAHELGLSLEYRPLPETSLTAATVFEPKRSARVIDVCSGQVIGIVGEYKTGVRAAFKVPVYSAGFELFTEGLLLATRHHRQASRYRALSRFPSIDRDSCFDVPGEVTYGAIVECIEAAAKSLPIAVAIQPVDIYQLEDQKRRRITVRVTFTADERTMTGEEAASYLATIQQAVITTLHATIV